MKTHDDLHGLQARAQSAGCTLTGPTSATEISSLLVDSQDPGSNAALELQSGGVLTVSGMTTIGTRGHISGSGILISTSGINNNGELNLGAGLRIAGGMLTNNGSLIGGGQVDNALTNGSSGEVRVAIGQRLKFTDNGIHNNAGRIEAIGNATQGQAEIEFTGQLTNNVSTGLITGRNAKLRFTGGLDNQGSVALSIARKISVFNLAWPCSSISATNHQRRFLDLLSFHRLHFFFPDSNS